MQYRSLKSFYYASKLDNISAKTVQKYPCWTKMEGSVLKLGCLHIFQMIKKRHDCNTYNPVTPLLPIIQTPEFEMFSIWVKNKDKDDDRPIQLPIPKNSIRTFFNPLIFFQPSD